jgi:predicted cupin superfamily sugar epimerase
MIEALLRSYIWYDHPEGPKFVETYRDAFRTSGHWLFLPGAVSRLHKVKNNEEIWAIHAGRLLVHVLTPDGKHVVKKLGMDLDHDERPVVTVPIGLLQGAELPEGEAFAFGTNVCAPSFVWTELVIADREKLLAEFPGHTELIKRLTPRRESPNPALPTPASVTPAAGAPVAPAPSVAGR